MRTYNTVGVMANSNKWSGVKFSKPTGEIVLLPETATFKDGSIKKGWLARLNRLSVADALWLHSRGAEVSVEL